MSTAAAEARPYAPLSAEDPRQMLPLGEVATLLDVDPTTLMRSHERDPAAYPAERVGTLWRIPRWWVERKIAAERSTA